MREKETVDQKKKKKMEKMEKKYADTLIMVVACVYRAVILVESIYHVIEHI